MKFRFKFKYGIISSSKQLALYWECGRYLLEKSKVMRFPCYSGFVSQLIPDLFIFLKEAVYSFGMISLVKMKYLVCTVKYLLLYFFNSIMIASD